MRATFQVIIEHQSILPQMLELIARHATLSAIQIEHDAPAAAPPGQPVELRLLGQPQALRGGQPVALGRSKCAELLALLALSGGAASADQICDALWPRLPLAQARGALHTVVSALRRQLGACVAYRQPSYALDGQLLESCDSRRFLALSEPGASEGDLQRARHLYAGPLLGELEAAWAAPHRALVEQRYDSVLHRLAQRAEQGRDHQRARELFQLLLQRDALDEPAHVGVMRCCMALQQRAEAVAQFHALRHALDSELGLDLEPDSEAHALYRQLLGV